MHQDIRLYINENEVDFTTTPDILYNYDNDTTNPTIIKNSYTKQLTIEGTDNNNRIFNSIWDLTMVQPNGTISYNSYFNPSKRTDFTIYLNGDTYETGYVKLNSVNKTHNKIEYNITLYGGIGDFFYSLTSNETGEKLKLSDLAYTTASTPTSELDFFITKDTVREAWRRLYGNSSNALYDIINFAPAYNGIPENLSSDKILVNTKGFYGNLIYRKDDVVRDVTGYPTGVTVDGKLYTTRNGFALAECDNMTEWEMRDLRSYNQRPVIRMKSIINACCDPNQNGGYEVVLDNDFFNSGNTYFEDCWVTLPMLSDLDYEETTQQIGLSANSISIFNYYRYTYGMAEDGIRSTKPSNVSVTFRPFFDCRQLANANPSTASTLYTSAYVSGSNPRYDKCGVSLQLIGYDANGEIVAGSDIQHLTSDIGSETFKYPENFSPAFSGVSVYEQLGYLTKVSNGLYQWNNPVTLSMDCDGKYIHSLALVFSFTYKDTTRTKQRFYTSTSFTETQYNASTNLVTSHTPTASSVFTYAEGSEINSGAKITKQTLLGMDGTPCDYLLYYCKTFGLMFEKDPIRKRIYIKTRNNYYSRTVNDWDDRIDRSKTIEISPLTFESKWYSFNYTENDKAYFASKYYDKWGTEYGKQKIYTGYEFDSETKELIENNIYKSGVDVVEKSKYFKIKKVSSIEMPNYAFNWVTYNLYDNSGNSYTSEICVPSNATSEAFGNYGDYYDVSPKLQLRDKDNKPIDGAGIFVFFGGGVESNHRYWLSDDTIEMLALNEQPCWLWTASQTNSAGVDIAYPYYTLPYFGRCTYEYGQIYKSWDFGQTKELYVPGMVYTNNSNIYNNYWSNYIQDLFNTNTRKMTCYIQLPRTQGNELMKHFYWIDKVLWRISKIFDWNVTNDNTTKVELVKVQDIENYHATNEPIEPVLEPFTVTGTTTPTIIPASGGSFILKVTSNRKWFADDDNIYYNDVLWGTIPNFAGRHSYGETVFSGCTATENTGVEKLVSIGCEDEYDNWAHFTITQAQGTEPPTPTGETFSVTGTTTPTIIPASGGSFTLTINSNMKWFADDDDIYYGDSYWGTIPNFAGAHSSGITTFTGCTATANTTGLDKGVIVGCENDYDEWAHFIITQSGNSII